MACGDHLTAKVFRKDIPKDDPHVRYVLGEYDRIYTDSTSQGKEKKRRSKKNEVSAPTNFNCKVR